MNCLKPRLIVAVFVSFLPGLTAFAAPPGNVISNQAYLDYLNSAGVDASASSNIVQVTTAVVRSPASVEFTRVVGAAAGDYQETLGPSACFQGGAYQTLADPVLTGGGTIDPTLVQDVSVTGNYNLGEPLFLRLIDSDQNVDAAVIDYAVVTVIHDTTGDSESIQLTETGITTGIFAGYLPSANAPPVSGDCVLQGALNTLVRISYTDPADVTDFTETTAILDPVSIVFESRSGTPVDGATIEIVDAVSGLPATVYGNDGVSSFPSLITSGATEFDSGGTAYPFATGEYRFPVVPAGDYQLIVTPPPDYSAPSVESIANLQLLPGAPFALGTASFGGTFTHSDALYFNFDIPVDRQGSTLFLQKSTMTTVAAPGDFVRYELTVENSSTAAAATNVTIVDQLPPGVRFMPGSVTRDGASDADPVIDPVVMSLEFDIGTLAVGEHVVISYVVEIVSGQRNDELINRATAFADAGLISNESIARIRLREDLFRSTATLIGRVLEGECTSKSFTEEQGVANVRVYLEDGRYAVSDQGGRFHFEDVRPGRHVAQLDPMTVPEYFEIVGCDSSPSYAGRADSQFVDLSRGSLKRADFYLERKAPPEGRVDVELQSFSTEGTVNVAFVVKLNGQGNVRIKNLSLMLMLPDGVTYAPGTMLVNYSPADDPRITGQALNLPLADQEDRWQTEVRFEASIAADVRGDLVTKARARFDSPIESGMMTPVAETRMVRELSVFENEGYVLNLKFDVLSAELSEADRLELDTLIQSWRGVRDIQIGATGHSDSQGIARRNRHKFADNYVLSRARANSAAQYVAQALNVDAGQIQAEGRGPDDPVADNATEEGRQQNRRVEMILSGMRPTRLTSLQVVKATSGTQITETVGAVPGTEIEQQQMADAAAADEPVSTETEPEIRGLSPGVEMLLPTSEYQPAVPVTKISIKHEPSQTVIAFLNEERVSALNFEGTSTYDDLGLSISRWRGVDLSDGANTVRIEVRNPDGSIASILERQIHFSGAAVRGEFVEDMSVLVADGKTRPVIAVRLFDKYGEPSRPGAIGTFRIEAPYRSWWDVQNDRKNKLVSVGNREPIYRVGADGIALIELEPTTQTGEVTLQLKFDRLRNQEIRTWLRAEPRDWILVGFAEGTVGFKSISDNQVAATAAGFEDGYFDDGQVTFFAKGRIKGEYLLTLAYDSERDRHENSDRFQTQVDPNAYYALYADESEQRYEASSQRKLYVKLERDQFVALFGDFDTGLSVTELSRYERRFNGMRIEYQGDNAGYLVFAAETDQSFVRDEIRGDGTSGLYRLSSAPIIANSDQVTIETRDRFDASRVLESRKLSRFLDYNLDTLDGGLYFKKPVPSRDSDFNPIFIVVEYESKSGANEDVIAGGRMSLRTTNDKMEVGITHINEGQQGAEADLSGLDFRWQASDTTLVKAEYANTNRNIAGVDQEASAYQMTLEHRGGKADLRAYVKEVEQNFGLGSQSAAEAGVRKAGVDARIRLNEQFVVEGEASVQENLETGTDRSIGRGLVRYENGGFAASTGLSYAEDKFTDGQTRTSELAEVGVSQRMFGSRMTLRANGSVAINEDAENADFPTSFVVGADYRLSDSVELFAEWEGAESRDIESTMTRVGMRASPWSRAQVNSSVTNESTEFGPRVFANLGLTQGFQVNENWYLDVGVDQTNTILQPGARVFDTDRELVSGSLNEDFLAAYVGAMYSADLWSANTRIEHRNSDSEERMTLISGWYREPQRGHSLSAGLTMFTSEHLSGAETTAADLKLGWAFRIAGGQWSFLDRVDLIFEESGISSNLDDSWRFINNFNANRRLSEHSQISLQYAFKYVKSNFNGLEFSGLTDLIGVDFHRALSPKWDAGAHTSIYHAYESDVTDYGFGASVGYNLRDNMWLTLGFNAFGFDDKDFAAARYTAEGPYLQITIKADQHTLKKIAGQSQ
jgi:uncharacterized repeat protein (TIGR01451 family)